MEIILIRLDRIGDFILGIPAYRAIRRVYPGDRITALVSPLVKDLAESCPYFDEVYLFEAQWLQHGRGFIRRWRSALKLAGFLRSRKPDQVIDFRDQGRLDTLVAGLSGAKVRAGFDLGFPANLFLNRKCPRPPAGMHQVERNLVLLKSLGVEAPDTSLEMWIDERDKKKAWDHLPRQESLPGVPRIAVHTGSAAPSKQWKAEDFSALIQELMTATQGEVVIIGGADDAETVREVMEGLNSPVVNLVGKLSLRQMAAILKTCRIFLGGDSGPAHLAAACGVPVVSLFSAANEPEIWRPWGEKVKVLTVKPDCSPCKSHTCKRTDGYFCMDAITVEAAVEAAKEFLSR